MSLLDTLIDFKSTVDALYGAYLDSTTGLSHVRADMERKEQESLKQFEEFSRTEPGFAGYKYGGMAFSYARHVPANSPPGTGYIHQADTEEIKVRNAPGGLNYRLIGNMTLVVLYQYWEDHYRAKIADDLGVEKNQIAVPLFGEIRNLRRAIIHQRATATPEVGNAETLRWFKAGEAIDISKEQFDQMIDRVMYLINRFQENIEEYVRRT